MATSRHNSDPAPKIEPYAVEDTFATRMEVERGDGFVCLEFYRERTATPFGNAEPERESVLVGRVVLLNHAVAQALRALARADGEAAPEKPEGLALVEARGNA